MIDRLRLRTTLLIPLLLLSVGGTVVSLMILRTIMLRQVSSGLALDLDHSVHTYQNLARQRRELLARESALLADLPSLKALMTGDDATIIDGGNEFWQVSGSDLFALMDRSGRLVTVYNRTPSITREAVSPQLEEALSQPEHPQLLDLGGQLFEVSIQPLLFGDRKQGSTLGYVVLGSAIDERVAQEVSDAAAAEVTFAVNGRVVASTLTGELQDQLGRKLTRLFSTPDDLDLKLGSEQYLAAARPLELGGTNLTAELIVLKSYKPASMLIRRVDEWVLSLAAIALLAGTGMLVSLSRAITNPIQNLVGGSRALALGNFDYELNQDGVQEIRELSRTFDAMRIELRRTQDNLIDSERLATIGRMASSISHDLRHYLSAMYANAEFMSDGRLPQPERDELFLEIRSAVQGMTDLLDSLLLFTQTGRTLHPTATTLSDVIEHAAALVRSHPAARDVTISCGPTEPLEAWVDSRKLGRALYNLLLNGCQAAARGTPHGIVTISLQHDHAYVRISVTDSGPGVSASVRQTMFLPFVSEGKESGVGLGLTLALQIAREHGGNIDLRETEAETTFTIVLPASILLSRPSPQGTAAIAQSIQAAPSDTTSIRKEARS